MVNPAKLFTVSRILGVIAGALAWTAALISYSQDGQIKFGLLAAGVFAAAMPFAASGKTKATGATEE
jgi:hypothetical protein